MVHGHAIHKKFLVNNIVYKLKKPFIGKNSKFLMVQGGCFVKNYFSKSK